MPTASAVITTPSVVLAATGNANPAGAFPVGEGALEIGKPILAALGQQAPSMSDATAAISVGSVVLASTALFTEGTTATALISIPKIVLAATGTYNVTGATILADVDFNLEIDRVVDFTSKLS